MLRLKSWVNRPLVRFIKVKSACTNAINDRTVLPGCYCFFNNVSITPGWLDNAGSFDKLIPLLSKGNRYYIHTSIHFILPLILFVRD